MSPKGSMALLCAFMLILSGCGGDNTNSVSSTPSSPQSSFEATSNASSLSLNIDLNTLAKQSAVGVLTQTATTTTTFSQVTVLLTHPIKKIQKTVELPVVDNKASGKIEGLVTGDWDLEVLVLNSDKETIYTSKQTINIAAGKTTKVMLQFEPVDPTGSVDIEIIPKPTFNELDWKPATDAVPATGNYVYLESQPGDYIGQGQTYLYSDQQASLSTGNNSMIITVSGVNDWSGDFILPDSLTTIQQGLYQQLQRYPFNNPVKGGLDWSGEGRGCNTLNGWIAVDKVVYEAKAVKSVDFRFAQHCEGFAPALFGAVHWEFKQPVGTNWQPDPASVPAQGNYMYLESDMGDYIGGGGKYLYVPADANITINNTTNQYLSVGIAGDQDWFGDFMMPQAEAKLKVGLYEGLQRYPFHNPVKGGLNWSGEGRGCNTLSGWFSVDKVSYVANVLQSVDLRFQQNCESGITALRGKLHWNK